jgi:hypothetical protein
MLWSGAARSGHKAAAEKEHQAGFRPAVGREERITVQPQRVGHPFVEEHAQHLRPALDHQAFYAPFFEFGDDVFGGNCFTG